MTSRDDFPGEMEAFPFDDTAADAVFGSSDGADSAPEEFRDVAELVHAARRTGSADELVGEDVIVARIAAAIGEHAAPPQGDAHERIFVLKRFRTAKVTAAATAVLLLGGTAAAAASGSLPTPMHHHHDHHADLAVRHIAAAPHHHGKRAAGISGVVASVNGLTVDGSCGVADMAGAFTVTAHMGSLFMVNVAPTTTFAERGIVPASFANVCVGAKVGAEGVVAGTTVTGVKIFIEPPHVRTDASGVVASVNGVATAGACGVSGMAGAFMLSAHEHTTFTVNVATTTAYVEDGVVPATFGNVCVGSKVKASGTVVDTTVTATTVTIKPPHVRTGAAGMVASVNGVSTPGTCGAANLGGAFTLTAHDSKTFTVNVDPSTTFTEHGITAATFLNVCVGEFVAAKGTVADPVVTATEVFILPALHHDHKDRGKKHEGRGDHRGAFGTVASVNGGSATGTCGSAGLPGSFTITGRNGTTFTVNVTSTTTAFKVPGIADPTFANVCVGTQVGAKGSVTDTTVAATDVFVFPPHSDHESDHGHHGDGHRGDGDAASHNGPNAAKLSTGRHGHGRGGSGGHGDQGGQGQDS